MGLGRAVGSRSARESWVKLRRRKHIFFFSSHPSLGKVGDKDDRRRRLL